MALTNHAAIGTDNLPVSTSRIWDDLMALAAITEPDRPYTRRSFTPMFETGRAWLTRRMTDAGCSVSVDAGGNLIGRIEGRDPDSGTIVIGSHSDTVPNGGRFDGTSGVVVGLEVIRALRDKGLSLKHNLEVIDFLAEEPSDFGLSCVGSRAMAGRLTDDMLRYPGPNDEKLAAAITRMGGVPDSLGAPLRSDIAAFFELHIEQGVVLERHGIDVGIVTGIAGVTRIEVVFTGAADHAGTTPMHMRRDASLASSMTSIFVNRAAGRMADRGQGHFVGTTGFLEVLPNAANVVPRMTRMIVDARAENRAQMDEFIALLDAETSDIASTCGVVRERFAILSDTNPVDCDPGLRSVLRHAGRRLGLSTLDMASGAGHDAAFVAAIAPAAMLFVPSRDGKSHAPEEWTDADALAAGAATLFDAVVLCDSPDQDPMLA